MSLLMTKYHFIDQSSCWPPRPIKESGVIYQTHHIQLGFPGRLDRTMRHTSLCLFRDWSGPDLFPQVFCQPTEDWPGGTKAADQQVTSFLLGSSPRVNMLELVLGSDSECS